MRIAVLEDDPTQTLVISSCLRQAGHEIHEFRLTADLKRFCARESVDLYLLDWVLPDQSGEDFLRWLRTERNDETPAIFITSRDAESDVVAGLNAGADDFIIKPMSQAILLSRIEALMRRVKPRDPHASLNLPPYRIDPAQNRIWLHGTEIELTEKEFGLALFMFRNVGRLISRGHILEAVWGKTPDIPTRTVDTHMSRVRGKLQITPDNGFRVVPTYNFGYRLERMDAGETEAPDLV